MAFPNTYSSVTYNSPAGAVDITITIPDGVGITETANREFYLIDIGAIEFKSDVPARSDDSATSIATEQGKLKITVWDNFVGTTTSIFSTLKKITANKFIPVEVTVGVHEFLFVLEQGSIKFDEKTNFTELTFTPNVKYELSENGLTTATSGINISVPELWADVTALGLTMPNYSFVDGTATGMEYVRLIHVIRYGLLSIYGKSLTSTNYLVKSPTVLIDGDFNSGDFTNRFLFAGDNYPLVYLRETNSPKTYDIADLPVLQTIARIAATSGCYFGYAFGTAYYIYRLNTSATIGSITTKVEMNYSNFLDLEQVYNLEPINSVTNKTLNYTNSIDNASGDPLSRAFSLVDTNTNINTFATQKYDIAFNAYVGLGEFQSGVNFIYPTTSGAGTVASVLLSGTSAYRKSLAFDQTRVIKFKYRGFDGVKPYQCFTLSSATPVKYRLAEDGSTTAIYRPLSLKYNMKTDTIEGQAYLIN